MTKTLSTLILAIILAGCGKTTPIPTGTLDDSLKTQQAFYSIRGGWDYSRAPIVFPYHIVDIVHHPDLSSGKDIIVPNVLSIGMSNGLIFGRSGSFEEFGKTIPESWFILSVQSNNLQTISDESAFKATLTSKGIDPLDVKPSSIVIDSFMKKGVDQFELARQRQAKQGAEPTSPGDVATRAAPDK